MYLAAIRSTISQASSPSSHSTTRPRITIGSNGLSAAVSDSATRGSRRRLRAFCESGPVRETTWSPWVSTHSGTVCGEPSARTVARWATCVPSRWRRTSWFSIGLLLSGDRAVEVGDLGHPREDLRHLSAPSSKFLEETLAQRRSLREPQAVDFSHAAHQLRRHGVLDRTHARRRRGALVAADPAGRLRRVHAVRADPGGPRHLPQGPHRAAQPPRGQRRARAQALRPAAAVRVRPDGEGTGARRAAD